MKPRTKQDLCMVVLQRTGETKAEIGRRLGLSRQAVDWRFQRLDNNAGGRLNRCCACGTQGHNTQTCQQLEEGNARIRAWLVEGLSPGEIARRLNVKKASMYYHIKRYSLRG